MLFNDWRATRSGGRRPDKTVFVGAQRGGRVGMWRVGGGEEGNRFMSHRKSLRFVVSHSPSHPLNCGAPAF